jgi:hypothetical protein
MCRNAFHIEVGLDLLDQPAVLDLGDNPHNSVAGLASYSSVQPSNRLKYFANIR